MVTKAKSKKLICELQFHATPCRKALMFVLIICGLGKSKLFKALVRKSICVVLVE